jgi:hypothetical protein
MEDYLKALNKELILTSMKTALQLIPIGIITNHIYICEYGNYTFHFGLECLQLPNAVFTVVVFSLIFIVTYNLEKTILPFLFISINKKGYKINKSNRRSFVNANKFLKRHYNLNPLIKLSSLIKSKEININRNEFYSMFSSLPITAILWLISINRIWAYICIVIVVLFLFYFFKLIETLYLKYIQ